MLSRAARDIASRDLRSIEDVLACIPENIRVAGKQQRQAAECALRVGKEFADRGRSGCAGAALVVALALDPNRLRRAERQRILCAADPLRTSRKGVLSYLRALRPDVLAALCPSFAARITTYVAVEELAAATRPLNRRYLELLRTRPIGVAKALMAVVDMAFLEMRRGHEVGRALAGMLSKTTRFEMESPESLASIASMCIADMASSGGLSGHECDVEVSRVLETEEFADLLDVATVRWHVRSYARQVSLFGFNLVERSSAQRRVFVLQAPSPEFEKAYRGAFIRETLNAPTRTPGHAHPGPLVPADALAESLVAQGNWVELRAEPFSRYVVKMPDPRSGVFDAFLNSGAFFEDIALGLEHRDWIVEYDSFMSAELASGLTVADFLLGLRALRLFAEFHTAAILTAASQEPTLLWNSLLPVLQETTLQDFIRSPTLSPEKKNAIVSLLTWADDPFLDIQYTPLVRVGGASIWAPRAFAASDLVRNAMARTASRVEGAGDQFSARVAKSLRTRFEHVVENRDVRGGGRHGEVDIALVAGDMLLLVECKHSLPGAYAEEHADALEDIQKAAHQLQRCETIISGLGINEVARRWFPGNVAQPSRIGTAIVTSGRVFTGGQIAGTPVRDWRTLRNLLDEGLVEIASVSNGTINGRRWCVWKKEAFTPDDLMDYLGEANPFARVEHRLLNEFWRIDIPATDRLPGLVRNTYAATVVNDIDEHARELRALGLRYAGSFQRPMGRLVSAKELRDPTEDDACDPVTVQPPAV